MLRPKIFVVYTGGTIGMRKTPRGYEPAPGHLQRLLDELPRFRDSQVPEFVIEQFDPLLDSSDLTPAHWMEIAESIRRNYAEYDGFLVIHGTDTMAFTASALSFMLEDLTKPVILTGSQIPLEETRNDAHGNLLTSLMILGRHHRRLAEVMICFDSVLLRGNRASKVSVDSFAAFASPNYPPLGRLGIEIVVDWGAVLRPRARRSDAQASDTVEVVELGGANVGSIRLFPGIKAKLLKAVLAAPVQGVVLECFGAGNAPTADPEFMDVIEEATSRGVVVVAVTQPSRGSANLSLYATGRALLDRGVVSGFDMTAEAALTKLFYLFEKGYSGHEVERLVQQPLVGELSHPDVAGGDTEQLLWTIADRHGG